MAIINRTSDSFFDQGATFAEEEAQAAVSRAASEGADVVDIGGVRAEAGPAVSTSEEINRTVPTIAWARETYPNLVISVDTWRAEVGEAACQAGADVINDSWAAADPELMDVAAAYDAGYICTHTNGQKPRAVPVRPHYEDVVASVIDATTQLAGRAVAKGVPKDGILIDPTFGILYGKDTAYNIALLREVVAFTETGWPVLIAISHKDFIGEILDAELGDRLAGTLAATAHAATAGAAMFRAHQVHETRHVLEMIATINGSRPTARRFDWTA